MVRYTTYASVNDTNFYAIAGHTLSPQLIYLRHDVWSKGVVAILSLDVLDEIGTPRRSSPDDLVFGKVIHSVRPHLLDAGKGGELARLFLGSRDILELNRYALEQ